MVSILSSGCGKKVREREKVKEKTRERVIKKGRKRGRKKERKKKKNRYVMNIFKSFKTSQTKWVTKSF